MVGIKVKLASHVRIKKCPYCHSSDVRRSHRKNSGEVALSFVGIYPFRCESCYGRFRKPDGRLIAVISLVMKLVGWET